MIHTARFFSGETLMSYFKLYRHSHEFFFTFLAFFYFLMGAFTACLSNAIANRINIYSSSTLLSSSSSSSSFSSFHSTTLTTPTPIPTTLSRSSTESDTTLVSTFSVSTLPSSSNSPSFPILPLKDPLVEFLYSNLGRDYFNDAIPDYVVLGSLLLLFGCCLTRKTFSFTVLRRVFYILGTMYFIRAPFILMTFLPNPDPTCIFDNGPSIFHDAIQQLFFMKKTCGDVFFSGHSMIIWLNVRIWLTYIQTRLLKRFVFVYALLGIFTLPLTAFHYTIDVVIGSLLVCIVYSLFHWILEVRIGRSTWWGNLVRRLDSVSFSEFFKSSMSSSSFSPFPPSSSSSSSSSSFHPSGYMYLSSNKDKRKKNEPFPSSTSFFPKSPIPPPSSYSSWPYPLYYTRNKLDEEAFGMTNEFERSEDDDVDDRMEMMNRSFETHFSSDHSSITLVQDLESQPSPFSSPFF